MNLQPTSRRRTGEKGSVFILVLWISFGLVVLALYFADSMNFELRAADNRAAALEADAAIAGAARYAAYVMTTLATNGAVPELRAYRVEAVPVGQAAFWFVGRDVLEQQRVLQVPVFGLVDESSKLNLNTATPAMLENLPGMTAELAAAIVDWRDTDSNATENGAEDDAYQRLNPARRCKNAPFESVDELSLVYGATHELLYGEDANRNGLLDANENDGNVLLPEDNRDSRLDPGILEYLTVYSRQPNTRSDGSPRVNVTANNNQQLRGLLEEKLSTERANQIIGQLGGAPVSSVLEFYARSGMNPDEFMQVESDLTHTNSAVIEGLINVNTASEAVLSCIPGIGLDKAPVLVAQRASNPATLASMAWVKEVLDQDEIRQAGPYLTGQTYQFTADIAALGHFNRGFRRARFIFDVSEGEPRIVYRQDLTSLGWALGAKVRENLQLARR